MSVPARRGRREAHDLLKKRILPVCLLLTVLAGCAGRSHSEKEKFLELRSRWLSGEQTELHTQLRADYGERVYDYVLDYAGNASGGVITVEEPLMLAGVSVELSRTGAILRYDGVELDTGAVLGGLSPVQTFPLLLQSWASGPVTDCWEETRDGVRCLVSEFDLTEPGETDVRLCRTWFRADTGDPFAAELLENGRTVVFASFRCG